MPEDAHNFASTRARLEEIVVQVRKKDTSLEASLDLLEEGVRLANQCTELIDHADWEAGEPGAGPSEEGDPAGLEVDGTAGTESGEGPESETEEAETTPTPGD